MSEKVILEMKDIVKDYSGFKAVDHVDFSLHKGEIVAIIGPSGSEKVRCCGASTGSILSPPARLIWKGRRVWYSSTSIFSLI